MRILYLFHACTWTISGLFAVREGLLVAAVVGEDGRRRPGCQLGYWWELDSSCSRPAQADGSNSSCYSRNRGEGVWWWGIDEGVLWLELRSRRWSKLGTFDGSSSSSLHGQ